MPGGANLIKGDVVNGGAHFILGIVAKALFGGTGLLLVHANSLVKARTGQHLHGLLGSINLRGGGQAQAATTTSNTEGTF